MKKIKEHINASIAAKQAFLADEALLEKIEEAADVIATAFKNGNKLLLCGNGGSACDAMHIAEELTGNYDKRRKALPAIPLTDAGHLTCTANDFGYEEVFARGVQAYGKQGDVLLAISTSGNSKNVIRAVEEAYAQQMEVIALTGKDGGFLKATVANSIIVPSNNTANIQECHIMIGHILIELVEAELFG